MDIVNYSYWVWDGVLSKEFCDSVLAKVDWENAETATINGYGANIVDTKQRVTDVAWQGPMDPIGCVAKTYIDVANRSAGWHYVLSDQEPTQIGRYKSVDNGFYDWHMDSYPPKNGIQRKLTCVILLNDSTDYEGGELQIKNLEDRILLKNQGSVIVFPSFIDHRVTPVTKGVRYTAVTWALGPSFR
jgi:PKHD-type hydroxylase